MGKDGFSDLRKRPRRVTKIGDTATGAFILICDIVSFSRMDPTEQADAVVRLFDFLQNHELLKSKYDGYINGTGDGALLAWSQKQAHVPHQQLIDFAESMLAHMRGATKSIGMRIGIHFGQFRKVEPPSRRLGIQLVGTGLNRCARVSSLGDDGHIIVSEDFLKHWNNTGGFDPTRFYPPSQDPITAFVKHDEPLGVRQYIGGRSGESTPEKLLKIFTVDDLIKKTLAEIEEAFVWAMLVDHSREWVFPPPRDAKAIIEDLARKLSARVSIFSPSTMKGGARKLCPTQYRYHRDPFWQRPGKTEYSIRGSIIEGPVAKAYLTDHVQVLSRLSSDKERYGTQMEDAGVDRLKTKLMTRHAKAYLSIPFGLKYVPDPLNGPYRHEPEGVVCIDVDDDLSAYEDKELLVAAGKLRDVFNVTLSSLWRLRTS